MGEPAIEQTSIPPRTFREIAEDAAEWRRINGVDEVSEEQAMELALEAQREVREEMRREND